MTVELPGFSLDRMVRAVEQVRERLSRAVVALEGARVPYAVAGGNAVAAWVSRVDEAATRSTKDVNILIRRDDYDAARSALEGAGFVHTDAFGRELFLDAPGGKASEAVHLFFANETMGPHEALPNPDVGESEDAGGFRVLALPALVRIKLTAFRDKDRTHLRDLIDVGLIDESWYTSLPPELAERLRSLIDTPGG